MVGALVHYYQSLPNGPRGTAARHYQDTASVVIPYLKGLAYSRGTRADGSELPDVVYNGIWADEACAHPDTSPSKGKRQNAGSPLASAGFCSFAQAEESAAVAKEPTHVPSGVNVPKGPNSPQNTPAIITRQSYTSPTTSSNLVVPTSSSPASISVSTHLPTSLTASSNWVSPTSSSQDSTDVSMHLSTRLTTSSDSVSPATSSSPSPIPTAIIPGQGGYSPCVEYL